MAFSLTSEQQAAVDNRGGGLLVSAAAGSGKTRVLVERLLARVEGEGLDIDRFLVITYTKAAAAELRGRIVEELSARLAERPTDAHLRRQATLVYTAQKMCIRDSGKDPRPAGGHGRRGRAAPDPDRPRAALPQHGAPALRHRRQPGVPLRRGALLHPAGQPGVLRVRRFSRPGAGRGRPPAAAVRRPQVGGPGAAGDVYKRQRLYRSTKYLAKGMMSARRMRRGKTVMG